MKFRSLLKKLFGRKPHIQEDKTDHKPKLEWATIWKIPNKIWENGFAANKPGNELHPGIVMVLSNDETTCTIIPGTSRKYNVGKCVYNTRLKSDLPKSYFLIEKRMTIANDEVLKFKRGWSSVMELDEEQKEGLYNQARVCINMNLNIRPTAIDLSYK